MVQEVVDRSLEETSKDDSRRQKNQPWKLPIHAIQKIPAQFPVEVVEEEEEADGEKNNQSQKAHWQGHGDLVVPGEEKWDRELIETEVHEVGAIVLEENLQGGRSAEIIAPQEDTCFVVSQEDEYLLENVAEQEGVRSCEGDELEYVAEQIVVVLIDLVVLGVGEGCIVGDWNHRRADLKFDSLLKERPLDLLDFIVGPEDDQHKAVVISLIVEVKLKVISEQGYIFQKSELVKRNQLDLWKSAD